MSQVGDTSIHGTGTLPLVPKTLVLDVCMRITAYTINSNTSMNFAQEYVSITLSIISTFFIITTAVSYFQQYICTLDVLTLYYSVLTHSLPAI